MADDYSRIQVDGLREALRDLRKLDKDIPKEIRKANLDAAQLVAPVAKAEAPKGKTGKLAGSVRASATQRAGTLRAGRAGVLYAGPIHFGWFKRHIRPNPFLWRAADRMTGRIVETYVAALNRAIRRFNA